MSVNATLQGVSENKNLKLKVKVTYSVRHLFLKKWKHHFTNYGILSFGCKKYKT